MDEGHGVICCDAVFSSEDVYFSVLYEFIWPADALDWGVDAGGVEKFDDAGAESIHEYVVLKGADDFAFLSIFGDELCIERFDPAWIDEGDRVA